MVLGGTCCSGVLNQRSVGEVCWGGTKGVGSCPGGGIVLRGFPCPGGGGACVYVVVTFFERRRA